MVAAKAKVRWHGVISARIGRKVLLSVNSEAARFSVIKSYNPSSSSELLCMATSGKRQARQVQWFFPVGGQGPSKVQLGRWAQQNAV